MCAACYIPEFAGLLLVLLKPRHNLSFIDLHKPGHVLQPEERGKSPTCWRGMGRFQGENKSKNMRKKTTGDLHTYTGAREKGYVLGLMRLLVALPKLFKGRPILESP